MGLGENVANEGCALALAIGAIQYGFSSSLLLSSLELSDTKVYEP